MAQTQTPPASAGQNASDDIADVVITGYRRSLLDATRAKQESIGISDSVFAEDIGKFPDTNIAEAFNRVPGIQIVRDATNEGFNVAIRGLGVSFTRVLLNGAPVAIASTGPIDASNQNREVDLNLFPTEFFTKLTVQKTAMASTIEGGAAGTIDMRSARPFDNPGAHLTYNIQATSNQHAGPWGQRGSLLASDTWGPFGVLIGLAGVHNPSRLVGYETIDYTPIGLRTANGLQCSDNCNKINGNSSWVTPTNVPPGTGNGLTDGEPIDQAFLLAHNPGLTLTQINNALIPRLGRPMDEVGDRNRYSGVLGLEYRPTDRLHFYVDSIYGRLENDLQRFDMDWVGRNGASIPLNMQVDSACTNGCVVTSGTFANSQFFLEYRPYTETTDFWGVNPGLEWQISDDWKVDLRANKTHSTFHRESPSVLVATNTHVTLNYTNNGGIPSFETDQDLNDPSNFSWAGGRLNIQDERRVTETKGVRGSLTFGHGGAFNVSVGGAYDETSRFITAVDGSALWQAAVCGDNPTPALLAPNSQPPCLGSVSPTPGSGYPTYPYLGNGVTAGVTGPLVYQGSIVPSPVPYLHPTSDGFISLDWPAFAAASQYDYFHSIAGSSASSNTGAAGGSITEKVTGAYGEFSGNLDLSGHNLRYTLGARWVHTQQIVAAALGQTNPANAALLIEAGDAAGCVLDPNNAGAYNTCTQRAADGSLFPNSVIYNTTAKTYDNVLPAAQIAYNVTDNVVVKLAASKTMTRANPQSLLPGASFSDIAAQNGTLGSPDLRPYISENIDFGIEYYLGGSSYWSVNPFRKRIQGFTSPSILNLPFSFLAQYGITYQTLNPSQQQAIDQRGGPDVARVNLTQQVNSSGALTLNGLEINYVQSLDPFIGRFGLDGFGFNFNYTLIDQFGTGSAPAIALGVAPHSYNLTLYYEHGPVSARISTVFNKGSQLSAFNTQGIAAAALYSDDYQQWDFSSQLDLSQIFGWRNPLQLTFDVVNVFQARRRAYFQYTNATDTEYDPGRTLLVGFRGKF